MTPHLEATAGSILISAQSLPGTPSPEVMCETVPTTPIVVVSSCIVTSCPIRSVQWRAVPTYWFPPPAKMKFAVQPAGATMHPAAETPADCTPGHSVLSASAGTVAVPLVASCVLTIGVRSVDGARTGPLAEAEPATASVSAQANAALRLKRK